ncbi:MAG: DUF3159 domain-containing protein [Acidimicrobiia bacterium]|nr:DUF3159 domain-containing protein [Acidimicrobiia bacterium]MBT8194257.1 DUF3159 domain-containing protein [Acidimicrobiia bacterium]NNJ46837.1 DUF3159 domain-containing protein [Acidimicrobiia bacterium]NNL13443.1 DUF3159 domain-containing protein [Acidimicrobiia bacterium]NNL97935.1 DUF3159 domain-containing protein [Acidimicrobiia bacterium]
MTPTVNDDIRSELSDLFVGDRTLGDSFAPPLLFVAANALWSLGVAAAVAVAAGVLVAFWRIRKGQQVVYALAGIGAVGFAAFLALRSGRAESYFLPGIVAALGWAGAAFVSILVKRPLAGWSSWAFRRWPRSWYWRDDVRPAYSRVSWIWFWYFAIRGLVQAWLFVQEQPEVLALWKTLTSWPTILPLFYLSYRVGMAKRDALGGPTTEEHLAGAQPPYVGGQRRF